ncbi:thiol:disulfide interchange protein DsbA/DsbL [Pseudoalteromonas sp. McH1-7]|uniref:Thiol:disulfide interchange protein n=1 Tax=Pseudoalteromonas peptidolytica F12-50-A1 TaxID=1315280 RepID=A0A8I0MYP4_9GAMM|nr:MULTISPECIES: thiol:disulfide interchange protein DsbA/DsbL [Pseudoalteromonas]MBE0347758.1 thiol:disulfide interchange protein DsbA [Pseudoalteromonas peptidolytica F12-50-A1]MDW7551494.1 thiol:disulfide interchange protein DsbA/DsbL [Pseudoalteromonas peptidolytica]NLR16853.1 thiol:disulfide interchange protein DsbA/DsbL [Pseudoalteromonas peptidolytica]NUZ13052.1 thiol:disulfide interchange protein DsbA/DsbL [Pseudoalteromonas sp. McH1-7]RRS07238.1 thiol:disulfide interchange protein Dsb
MLKKLKVALIALFLPVVAMASDFVDGKHYSTLTTAQSKDQKVTEFFSFYCPHCFRFEPIAKAIEKNLPDGAYFEKSHVNFLGGIPKDTQTNLSYAYIIAKQAGKSDLIAEKIFHTIHVEQNRLLDIKDLKTLMELNGISATQFDQAVTSMPVISAENNMLTAQEKFSKAGALTGVPTFIVNDKYKIEMKGIESQEQLDKLIAYLLKK